MGFGRTLVVETDQNSDLFRRWALGETATARLLFRRCQEALSQSLPCQDYARMSSTRDGASVCFCVCDGVGSSYQGGFAARYLAIQLVNWLRQPARLPEHPALLAASLRERLEDWAQASQAELNRLGIPAQTPGLVREVLEELRDSYGSETVFLCGRIDSSHVPAAPGAHPGARAIFYWMGNVNALVFGAAQEPLHLGDQNNDSNRWSTLKGPRGELASQELALEQLTRLIVHTDGVKPIREDLATLGDAALQQRTQELLSAASNDDMTILDIQWAMSSHPNAPFGKARSS